MLLLRSIHRSTVESRKSFTSYHKQSEIVVEWRLESRRARCNLVEVFKNQRFPRYWLQRLLLKWNETVQGTADNITT